MVSSLGVRYLVASDPPCTLKAGYRCVWNHIRVDGGCRYMGDYTEHDRCRKTALYSFADRLRIHFSSKRAQCSSRSLKH